MTKGKQQKDKQNKGQRKTTKGQTFSFGHYTVCPFVVILLPLYCFSFCRFFFGLYIVCPLLFSFALYFV
jgi:hypothetical protein